MIWAAQEILVTRSNLEDKNTLMIELKNKVDELALHNEYQLRLKDMNYSEKIKVRCARCNLFTQGLAATLTCDVWKISRILLIRAIHVQRDVCSTWVFPRDDFAVVAFYHFNKSQEITEKFTQDLEQSKNKFELLR